jgi:hypothetical protein
MARGWESKAVEAQKEEASNEDHAADKGRLSPEEADLLRKREGLLLSKSRVLHDLEVVRNTRYRDILMNALRHLESELAGLEDHRYKQR